ncbi:MAG: hypothetical protein R3E66_19855 [bacterium]
MRFAMFLVTMMGCGASTTPAPWTQGPLVGEQPVTASTKRSSTLEALTFVEPNPVDYDYDDDPSQRAVAETECARNAEACLQAGVMAERGLGGSSDVVAAKGFYERACAMDVSEGCSLLGGLYWRDLLGVDQVSLALTWFKQGCALENEEDCVRAAYILAQDVTAESQRDAEQYLQQACVLGYTEVCLEPVDQDH